MHRQKFRCVFLIKEKYEIKFSYQSYNVFNTISSSSHIYINIFKDQKIKNTIWRKVKFSYHIYLRV